MLLHTVSEVACEAGEVDAAVSIAVVSARPAGESGRLPDRPG